MKCSTQNYSSCQTTKSLSLRLPPTQEEWLQMALMIPLGAAIQKELQSWREPICMVLNYSLTNYSLSMHLRHGQLKFSAIIQIQQCNPANHVITLLLCVVTLTGGRSINWTLMTDFEPCSLSSNFDNVIVQQQPSSTLLAHCSKQTYSNWRWEDPEIEKNLPATFFEPWRSWAGMCWSEVQSP